MSIHSYGSSYRNPEIAPTYLNLIASSSSLEVGHASNNDFIAFNLLIEINQGFGMESFHWIATLELMCRIDATEKGNSLIKLTA